MIQQNGDYIANTNTEVYFMQCIFAWIHIILFFDHLHVYTVEPVELSVP